MRWSPAGGSAPGERVLIHAVGSGVGTAASQIAKHLGATVIGTSRSADKLARALVYGLDIGIDTSKTPFREALTEPVHVVLDAIGGPAFGDNLAVLAPQGRLVLLGFLAGSRTTADLGPMVRKRLEVIGTAMRVRSLEERKALIADFAERMLPLFDRRIEQARAAPARAAGHLPDDPVGGGPPGHGIERDLREARRGVVTAAPRP